MAHTAPNLPPILEPLPPFEEPRVSTLRWVLRIVRWSTYLAALITLILLLHKTQPPAVLSTPQAAATAEQKVSEVQQSVAQGQPATLRLDETELNSYLANHLDLAPAAATPSQGGGSNAPTDADVEQVRSSVRDVKVQMEGDQVHAYLVFDLHGKEMSLDLVGKLGAADGYLKFEPVSGHIGSLPIPQSALESAVKQLMESPVNREKLRLPSDVSDLRIENGELVTTYH
ncbi:MAG TPA: hypothetical protein VK805_19665 [Candidatus Baltobacteraceae bacterium]|jgi:hypothetical protein|nr:hypothetical protein [Candidatus Baltobacteraceae bacterium]